MLHNLKKRLSIFCIILFSYLALSLCDYTVLNIVNSKILIKTNLVKHFEQNPHLHSFAHINLIKFNN